MTPLRSLRPLALVLLAAAAGGRLQAQSPPQRAAVGTDTLIIADPVRGTTTPWPYRIERDEGPPPMHWLHIESPHGGTLYAPADAVMTLGLVAASEYASTDRPFFSVVDVQRGKLLLFFDQWLGVLLLVTLGLSPLLFLGLLAIRYRGRFRREREHRQLVALSSHRLAEGREEERLRLAQDLHDGPVQDLHALRMRLSLANRASAGDGARAPIEVAAALTEIEDEVQHVIRELRAISENLRPPSLGPFGLAAALRTFCDRLRQAHPDIEFLLALDDDGLRLPEPVRLALFRIAQEAINNAVHHANPTRLDVTLRLDGDAVLLEVCDDGDGYEVPADFTQLAQEGHYGLLGMNERAESIGALLHIESHPGEPRATTVRIRARRTAPEWRTSSARPRVKGR